MNNLIIFFKFTFIVLLISSCSKENEVAFSENSFSLLQSQFPEYHDILINNSCEQVNYHDNKGITITSVVSQYQFNKDKTTITLIESDDNVFLVLSVENGYTLYNLKNRNEDIFVPIAYDENYGEYLPVFSLITKNSSESTEIELRAGPCKNGMGGCIAEVTIAAVAIALSDGPLFLMDAIAVTYAATGHYNCCVAYCPECQ